MAKYSFTTNYQLKWQLKSKPHYQITVCGKIINLKTGREIKKTVNGYSVGFWIDRKFITIKNIKKDIIKIKDIHCPF